MTNPLVELQDVPVEIICLSVTPPVIRNGRVTCQGEGPCEVVLEEPEPRLEPGMRVVLDGGPDRDLRIKGLVTGMEGLRLRVETERVVPTDKRSFPRMYGGIHVRYRVLPAGEGEEDCLCLGLRRGSTRRRRGVERAGPVYGFQRNRFAVRGSASLQGGRSDARRAETSFLRRPVACNRTGRPGGPDSARGL